MACAREDRLLVGCAAGFSGDRTDAAGPVVDTLIAMGGPAFLIFETLAERTLALAQLRRRADANEGFEPLLEDMLRPVLARCMDHGIRIVSNFGAANPKAAARKIRDLAMQLGLPAPRIAVIHGDDLSDAEQRPWLRERLGSVLDDINVVSANAYQGAQAIAQALDAGAQIVVAGRVADPSLVVGPALSHFRWSVDDWDRIAGATMAGHLLECGAQVCGGYFADPGFKDVPDLHNIGYPIAEVFEDGRCIIGKAADTGGAVTLRSMKEQLLYEIHDPSAYLTPDVTASISEVTMEEVENGRVLMSGVRGCPRPDMLKVNVCYEGGWLAEGEISYAGAGAEARARLAADVLRHRLDGLTLRCDLIGALSVLADDGGRMLASTPAGDARDVRLRVAAAHADKQQALRLVREVTALYTCGPAGGGGVRTSITPRLALLSGFVPRGELSFGFTLLGACDA
ncbi:acyclic terpene utilization AtuA family protein [Hydrogenophaga sp. BPS33]|uniref:acyclic terpene utilization AtuA family protein n=1 Tax=Hydrogenophaga sp. BPS33 TaxID=2651974 RepID=UPI0013201068|nr:acyclic terpene utilization AtuA family protein [Hydrogenophaga sp. BPS33]QHE85340.1 DUF1446 domain-containing protein [Hydrogenophaga sp. BPS33]